MKINFLRLLPKMFLICLLIALQACEKDPDPVLPPGSAGYFVVNEGGFGNSNTSISFYDRTTGEMTNDVFTANNDRPLGDQAQSLTVFEGKAYIAVQNSAKLEVIGADDFKSIKTITEGIGSPRYFIGITSTKGYLSDWEDGFGGSIKVIDLDQLVVVDTIATGIGPNKMLLKDGKVYVANSGGYSYDNSISVIDTSTDAVTSTIPVGDNPNSLQFDKDGNLWVASGGSFAYNVDGTIDEPNSTESTISKIVNGEETSRLTIDGIKYPGITNLSINTAGDNLFYIFGGAVYSMTQDGTATAFINDQYFYGLAVDPSNDDLIACEAPDYSSPGKVYVYRDGAKIFKTYVVGIAPNGVGFK